jgi:UDPglucose--hexose-1-phosphate uridylyltransferase
MTSRLSHRWSSITLFLSGVHPLSIPFVLLSLVLMRSCFSFSPSTYTQETFVFENDFPALSPPSDVKGDNESTGYLSSPPFDEGDFFVAHPVSGKCRVICFHPDPSVSLPLMTVEEITRVICVWKKETESLGRDNRYVQVFENKGGIMGCSNPHPHCQIWATSFLPNEVKKEDNHQLGYFQKYGTRLLEDYRDREIEFSKRSDNHRIIINKKDWLVVVPFWATWPFETMILPKFRVDSLVRLTSDQELSLAKTIKELTTIYDNLFETSFPYSMGWHGSPSGKTAQDNCHWLLHAHYLPPLLRSATVKKFMVGFELLAQAQRDLTPEEAARRLRSTPSDVHYTMR